MSNWTSYVRIWTVSNCELIANFLTFLGLYHLLFALEIFWVSWIIIWWQMFEKKSFQFFWEIWIWVAVILLQLYFWVWSAQRWEIPDFHPFNSLKSTGRKTDESRLCWLDKEMPMIWLFEAYWSKPCLLVFEALKIVSFLNVKCL